MTKPIRLLWVFSTFAVGGPQRRMATLVGSLGGGYEHLIFAMDGCYDAEAILPSGAKFTRIEAPVKKGGVISLANVRTFRRIIAAYEPNVICTTNWGAVEWLFANRGRLAVPHVHFEDGFGPDERPDAQKTKRVMMRRVAFRKRGVEFVAPSNVLKRVFTEVWKVAPSRVHLIPNGVDCARFAISERPDRPVTIGTIAALRSEKRLDRLIDCVAAMSDKSVQLLIVGDGPERAALEARAVTLGNRVRFAGEQSDVAPFLAEMDIYALSSDTEQMPISMVEGMAAALPVAATDVGDVARMVAGANRAQVVALGDDGALTRALDVLAGDADLRAALGQANRDKAMAEYDLAAMTATYDALFHRMAARS